MTSELRSQNNLPHLYGNTSTHPARQQEPPPRRGGQERRSVVLGPPEPAQRSEFEDDCHCLLIIDTWSSYQTSLFAPIKSGVIAQIGRHLLWHFNYTERHPKFVLMDGAGELMGAEITAVVNRNPHQPDVLRGV